MNLLEWVQTLLLIVVQVAMCAMFYFKGELAGIRKCKQIVDEFFAEKKEDGEN